MTKTCKQCGGIVKQVIPEGAPYWYCEECGKLDVSDVEGVTPGEIPEDESVRDDGS